MPTTPYILDFSDNTKSPITLSVGSSSSPGTITSLALFGQNAPLYGEGVNENFIHLLENFANATPPLAPIEGQLWFSNSDNMLRIYSSINSNLPTWTTVSSVVVADDVSSVLSFTPQEGSLWLKPTLSVLDVNYDPDLPNEQLFIYTNNDGWVHIGRNYVTLNGDQAINGNKIFTGNVNVNGTLTSTNTLTTNATVSNTLTANIVNISGLVTSTNITNSGTVTSQNITVANNVTAQNLTASVATTTNILIVNSSASITGALTVTGNINLNGATTSTVVFSTTGSININGNANILGTTTLGAKTLGATTVNGDLTISGSHIIWANGIDVAGNKITNVGTPTTNLDAVNKIYTDSTFICRDSSLGSGANTMTAVLSLANPGQSSILGSPADNNAATVRYVKDSVSAYVGKSGGNITGTLVINNGSSVCLNLTGNAVINGSINSVVNITASGSIVTPNLTCNNSLSILNGATISCGNNPITNVTMNSVPNNSDVATVEYVISKAAPTATEATAGIAKIASTSKSLAGSNDTDFITPLKLAQYVSSLSVIPAGTVNAFAGSTIPAGWLECNGSAVSRTGLTANLFSAIGITYGPGDGINTFNLPDLRGEFIRGWDHGRGVDIGRNIGSTQADELKSHTHKYNAPTYNYGHQDGNTDTSRYGRKDPIYEYTESTGGSETRPRNVALTYIIKI